MDVALVDTMIEIIGVDLFGNIIIYESSRIDLSFKKKLEKPFFQAFKKGMVPVSVAFSNTLSYVAISSLRFDSLLIFKYNYFLDSLVLVHIQQFAHRRARVWGAKFTNNDKYLYVNKEPITLPLYRLNLDLEFELKKINLHDFDSVGMVEVKNQQLLVCLPLQSQYLVIEDGEAEVLNFKIINLTEVTPTVSPPKQPIVTSPDSSLWNRYPQFAGIVAQPLLMWIPTAISPNSDILNEAFGIQFGPRTHPNVLAFQIKVYNRLGELSFESQDLDFRFFPTHTQGNNNVFYYELEFRYYDRTEQRKGRFICLE